MAEPGPTDQDNEGSQAVRAAWSTPEQTTVDYAVVVDELNASKLVGGERAFKRGSHVPITIMGYFNPNTDAFLVELKTKDL